MVGGVRLPRRFMFSDGVVAREDPVWFVKRFLDARPWSKQREVLRALRDHDLVAVRSCNGSGEDVYGGVGYVVVVVCAR